MQGFIILVFVIAIIIGGIMWRNKYCDEYSDKIKAIDDKLQNRSLDTQQRLNYERQRDEIIQSNSCSSQLEKDNSYRNYTVKSRCTDPKDEVCILRAQKDADNKIHADKLERELKRLARTGNYNDGRVNYSSNGRLRFTL